MNHFKLFPRLVLVFFYASAFTWPTDTKWIDYSNASPHSCDNELHSPIHRILAKADEFFIIFQNKIIQLKFPEVRSLKRPGLRSFFLKWPRQIVHNEDEISDRIVGYRYHEEDESPKSYIEIHLKDQRLIEYGLEFEGSSVPGFRVATNRSYDQNSTYLMKYDYYIWKSHEVHLTYIDDQTVKSIYKFPDHDSHGSFKLNYQVQYSALSFAKPHFNLFELNNKQDVQFSLFLPQETINHDSWQRLHKISLSDLLNCHQIITNSNQLKGIYFSSGEFYIFINRFYIKTQTDLIATNFEMENAWLDEAQNLKFKDPNLQNEIYFLEPDFRWMKTYQGKPYFILYEQARYLQVFTSLGHEMELEPTNDPDMTRITEPDAMLLKIDGLVFVFRDYFYHEISQISVKKIENYLIKDLFAKTSIEFEDERIELLFDYQNNTFVLMTRKWFYVLDYSLLIANKTTHELSIGEDKSKILFKGANNLLSRFHDPRNDLTDDSPDSKNIFFTIGLIIFIIVCLVGIVAIAFWFIKFQKQNDSMKSILESNIKSSEADLVNSISTVKSELPKLKSKVESKLKVPNNFKQSKLPKSIKVSKLSKMSKIGDSLKMDQKSKEIVSKMLQKSKVDLKRKLSSKITSQISSQLSTKPTVKNSKLGDYRLSDYFMFKSVSKIKSSPGSMSTSELESSTTKSELESTVRTKSDLESSVKSGNEEDETGSNVKPSKDGFSKF